jgi:hypothetical protein
MKSKLFILFRMVVLCSFTSCNPPQPPKQPTSIQIINGFTFPNVITNEWVDITTGAYEKVFVNPSEKPPTSAKIFIGDDWSVGGIDASNGVPPANSRFGYYTYNSCKDLPQGQNLRVRYEMYDAQGKVLQEESVTVSIDSCK